MAKRRDFLKMGLAAPALLAGAGSGMPKIPSVVIDPAKAKMSQESYGEAWIYFQGPTDQLSSMTAGSVRLKPGAEPHAPHQHPDEEFMVVTEGSGELFVDGKKTKVNPGSMMYCEGNQLHGIHNTGTVPLLFYFYKWKA